jgi:hypothetical protein
MEASSPHGEFMRVMHLQVGHRMFRGLGIQRTIDAHNRFAVCNMQDIVR